MEASLAAGPKRGVVGAAVVLLLLVMVGEVVHAVRGESLTWDEGDHIFAGYESWKAFDFGLNPEHPPLVKLVATLPLLGLELKVPRLQGRFFKTESYMDGRELLYRNGPVDGGRYAAQTLILRVRMFAMVFTVMAALLVFLAGLEMFGTTAGLLALTLFCFEPNLLAHGAYVATDMGASCTIFATVYAFWRWVRRPSWWRLVVVGLAGGVALATKHSGVLLLPMLVLLAAGEVAGRWFARRPGAENVGASDGAGRERAPGVEPRWTAASGERRVASASSGQDLRSAHDEQHLGAGVGRMIGALAVVVVVGVMVLWMFYGFRYAARPAGLVLSPTLAEYVGPLAGAEARGILLLGRFHLLPESWLYGLADVRAMANGMPSYFFGKVYAHGVWFYFPVLFTIKSTLGMMGLLVLTAFGAVRGWMRGRARELWFLLLPPGLYFVVAMGSHLNIGARHILPVWVFCCVLAGGGAAALARRSRGWAWVAGGLLAVHAASSIAAAPNYLAYSNEAWGGPAKTYRYLSDSNTDWGQQLVATSAYLRAKGVKDCWFAYFVTPFVLPSDYGIPCRRLPTFDSLSINEQIPAPAEIEGPVLISAGALNGFEFGSSLLNPYEAFRGVKPVAYVQDGVFVFEGRFAVPLASALSHMQQSADLLKAKDVAGGVREAEVAVGTAPGEVQPEIAMGDALSAAGRADEARGHYERALEKVRRMDPGAREVWEKTVRQSMR